VGGLIGQPFDDCAAKFAVEGFTESLASHVMPSFGVCRWRHLQDCRRGGGLGDAMHP
jgi:hypothetical protein